MSGTGRYPVTKAAPRRQEVRLRAQERRLRSQRRRERWRRVGERVDAMAPSTRTLYAIIAIGAGLAVLLALAVMVGVVR